MNQYRKIPALFMRGGTSKAAYIMVKDLPDDQKMKDEIIMSMYGSGDERQINGIGGADPLTSKVALIKPSQREDADVDYTFGYVGIKDKTMDYEGNCGNISSGVGPFALLSGLVKKQEPFTIVRVYNTNTKKIIEVKVPVKDGEVVTEGDYAIAGVPGTGAKITLNFPNAAGSKTGKLLPTGHVVDEITLADGRKIKASLVDAANPAIFVKAADIGFTGKELPKDTIDNTHILEVMEDIRTTGAVMMGLAPDKNHVSQAVPKVAFVAGADTYTTSDGKIIERKDFDLLARTKALQVMHKTYAVTGGICVATAACIKGTVVNEVVDKAAVESGEIRIGHPAGILEIFVVVEQDDNNNWILKQAGLSRTVKPIMEGSIYVPEKIFHME